MPGKVTTREERLAEARAAIERGERGADPIFGLQGLDAEDFFATPRGKSRGMHHGHFANELPKTRGDRWAYSDEKVKAVLLAAFPRFEEGSAHLPQRSSAPRSRGNRLDGVGGANDGSKY